MSRASCRTSGRWWPSLARARAGGVGWGGIMVCNSSSSSSRGSSSSSSKQRSWGALVCVD